MKCNVREIAHLSDKPCVMEGRLNYKKITNGSYRNQAVFKERWFRLVNNYLFYFKISDMGKFDTKQPAGMMVLENSSIQMEHGPSISFSFSISFIDEPEKRHIFAARSEDNVVQWVLKLRQCSYEYLRNQLHTLQSKIFSITGKDPLLMVPRNDGACLWAPSVPFSTAPACTKNTTSFSCHLHTNGAFTLERSKSDVQAHMHLHSDYYSNTKFYVSEQSKRVETSETSQSYSLEKSKTSALHAGSLNPLDISIFDNRPMYSRAAPSPPVRTKQYLNTQRTEMNREIKTLADLSKNLGQMGILDITPVPPRRKISPKPVNGGSKDRNDMTSNDKDFRFMATNDLMTELQKDSIKLDDDSERKVVKMLLRLLEDKNGEVQNLAVKCLGPLVNKVKECQVEGIVDTLCANMLSDTEQLRDISSIGLKTVISELPLGSNILAANVCKKITGRLSSAIEKQEDVSVQLEALDILADLLSRFGGLLISFHPMLLDSLLPQLASPRQAVRKRTIVGLSHLVMSCNTSLYNKLIDHLLEGLSTSTSSSVSRTHIQCIASVCRQAGHRFGEQLWRVAPQVLKHSTDQDEELREHCLQALEAFVLKCPKEVQSHIPTIIDLCLKMITYDPNYNYEDDEESGGGGEDEEMEDESFELAEPESDSEEYSDDDDMSWKVRRAAAKCLESVISTRHELLAEMYLTVSPALIARFKEREENVKCDILSAYTALLRATRPPPALHAPLVPAADSPQALLLQRVAGVVRGALRVIRGRSVRARACALALLRELLAAAPGCLADHAARVIRALTPPLTDKGTASSMKIETLVFVVWLVRGHEASAMRPHVSALLPAVLACVHDPFYKVTAEALHVLQTLVKVMRPLEDISTGVSGVSGVEESEVREWVRGMYDCTLVRLRATDMDQEVKERAIATAGQLICHFGDYLLNELPVCLPIFLERLRNEITRLTTVKALTKIASSPLRIDLRPILSDAVPILGSFLRKNQRALKLSTLVLLDTLVQNYSNAISIELLSKVLMEVPALVCEADLHCAQTALTLVRGACERCPAALTPDARHALTPNILALARSPLLQGGALKAMVGVLSALVAADVAGCGRRELLALLVAPVHDNPEHAATPHHIKQAYHSLAKCVAAVVVSGGSDALDITRGFLRDAAQPRSDTHHMFALLALAEIGRHLDLSSIPNLKEVLLSSFTPSSEEVKSAASYALGSVAVGNLPEFLPFILNEIEAQPKRQYLLLHSLKEIIACESCTPESVEALRPFIPEIWVQLSKHCQCAEEGSRNVVAECLGKLCLLEPQELLPHLKEFLKSSEPLTRTTAVTAVKFTISDQPQAIDNMLRSCMSELLVPLRDCELGVRRVALVAFNSAAHNKPSLVRDLLPQVLPTIYAETKVKKELIREVEMGPFKHSVDDGLDLRKAAFECMYTLLGTCLDRIDVFEFLRHVEDGLRDHYDIKMLTYLMCARLAHLCPAVVLQRLESLVEPLRATCTMKVKANSVKQEYEKQDELKRSALRAAAALLQIPDADKNPHLMDFVTQIKSFPDLQPIFESILKDSSGGVESNLMDQS